MTHTDLPAILGGTPVRAPGSYRTTPELSERDADWLIDWCLSDEDRDDLLHLGRPLPAGLALDPVVSMTGREAAAFGAEFAAVHAPGQSDAVVIPVSNGTHAITIALRALALHADRLGLRPHRPGASIIVPGLTWPATATAGLLAGYAPRLGDIDPATLTIDPAAVEALIDDSTVAIVLVDLYSRMAERDRLVDIAHRHDLALIEDDAHGHGAAWRGRAAGTIGHIGTFSFQGSKSLSAGDLGAVITTDRALADQLVSLAHCGRQTGASLPAIAANDRAAGVVAALARAQLDRFSEQTALRLATFAALDRIAADLPGVTPLAAQPHATRIPTYKWAAYYDIACALAPLSIDQLAQALAADLGCEVTRTYEPMVSSAVYQPDTDPMLTGLPWWDEIDPARYETPNAIAAYESVLCIEWAAGLDPGFPAAYATALTRIRRHAAAVADRAGR